MSLRFGMVLQSFDLFSLAAILTDRRFARTLTLLGL